jgi:RNA polymerase sigma-70 factor (ECF subfamily)
MPAISAATPAAIDSTVLALRRLADARDREAWAFIVERHHQRMFQSAVRITGDRELADDACQEAFLIIRDAAGRFQPLGPDPEAAAVSWIQRIAATCALKLLRSRRRRSHHEQQAGTTRPESRDHEGQDALETALRAELAELPESHRLPLALHYFSGLDYPSIASEVGCSVGNARVRVHRALERLRSRLVRAGTAVTAGGLATKLGAIEAPGIAESAHLAAKWATLIESPAAATTTLATVGGSIGIGISVAAKVSLAAAAVVAGVLSAAAARAGGSPAAAPAVTVMATTTDVSTTAAPIAEGLAVRYPGDRKISDDPHVLFTEDFESGRIEDIIMRWGSGGGDAMRLDSERSAVSSGAHALAITLPQAQVEKSQWMFGPHLYGHTRGVDRMHVRFYVKLHERHGSEATLFNLVAERVPTRWPNGEEGVRPDGALRFSSVVRMRDDSVRAAAPGPMGLYSYWHDMSADGAGQYWGKDFSSESDPIPRGRWLCVEVMVKANSDPDLADGEQALWIDGRQVAAFTGIRWRTSDELKLNSIWLLYGGNTTAVTGDQRDEAWFDDIVVADEYIGPIRVIAK